MRHPAFALVVTMLALAGAAAAQNAAPRETASATINGHQVAVEYGRPSLRGRSFDELIAQLSEDRMWRAGSEQVTTFQTETDLMVGG